MSVVLDIIGSIVIGSMVILIGLRLDQSIAGTADASMAQLNVQETAVEIVRTMERDFRRIAYNAADPTQCILVFDTVNNDIVFKGDIDNDGNGVPGAGLETVEWKLGPTITGLQNTHIHTLLRSASNIDGGAPKVVGSWVTMFKIAGYDRSGKPTNDKNLIRIVETTIQVENPYLTQDQVNQDTTSYARIFWRQTWLSSVNLKRWG